MVRDLRRVMPPESVVTDDLRLVFYGYDGTLFESRPDLALLPEETAQVIQAVRLARKARVPIVARGAATSLSGGPVPLRGGVVFSFTRMDRILDLDYANQRAVVQPGVVNQILQNELAKRRFFYAPDPASQCVCTLGGNVGENSGGPHCLKYGVTANHVLGLEVVLPDGRLLRTGGKALDAPGYDLTGIIVGSEGTFGLVTEIVCRITPLPPSVVTMLAIFDTLDGASNSVAGIIAEGIIPATLEMMDNPMIRAVEKHLSAGYPLDAEAVLLIELDGLENSLAEQVKQVEEVCRRNGVRSFQVARDEAERALLWKGRKGAFGAVVNIAPSKICTDISVPRTELPRVLAGVMEISRRWNIPITNVFHAGDGNLHPLVLFDPRDQDQVERAKKADQEITELAMKHGGVLTGEHGIGCGKRHHMPKMFGPPELRLMQRIKDVFDPDGVCNPDKVLPDRGEFEGREGSNDAVAVGSAIDRARIVEFLKNNSEKVVVRAGGTKSDTVADGVSVLDVRCLSKIISHDHENLTVTAECGVSVRELDEALAEKGQMLPCRPRFAHRATVGGVIAANDYGPHRLLYGAPRDYVTGITAVLPTGEVVRFGSACVKNVAGYAVEKLFIGSLGTLGVILDVTLRTVPRPEIRRTLILPAEKPALPEGFVSELLRSGIRPAALEIINRTLSRRRGLPDLRHLVVALEGFASEVSEMHERIVNMARGHGMGEWMQSEADYCEFWSGVAECGQERHVLRVSCPIAETMQVFDSLTSLWPNAPARASIGLGMVFVGINGNFAMAEEEAGKIARPGDGWVSWLAPLPPGQHLRPEGTALDVCRRVKRAFDPAGVLPDIFPSEEMGLKQ